MGLRITRTFSFLLVLSSAIVLFILLWGNLSVNISRAEFSPKTIFRGENRFSDSEIQVLDINRNGTLPPAVFTTAQQAKIAVSIQPNPVTKLKTNQSRGVTRSGVGETPITVIYRRSFKKLPQWDFEDVYNQDAPPRQTTCAQSLRNSEDESFKKAFLPNIRLFLHKDSINMSEWNRLSHFNNPFGFMDYQYDRVMTSVKLIPKPKEPLLSPGSDGCVRCAVVGTGGILNGSRKGKEIDAHDYVFRMNAAVTKGYEEDVGNRTSVYVHTAHSINSSPYMFRKYGYRGAPNDEGIKYVLIPEGMRDFNWLEGLLKDERVSAGPYRNKRPRTYYGGQFNESRFYVLHQDFLRYVRNRFLRSRNLNTKHWAIVRPTNGAFALFLALQTCDTVDAYGFMTEDYKKYSNYYVQRYAKTHVVFYINHDYNLEKNTWKKLHDSKVLQLYQGKDTDTGTEKQKQL
ncbi:alpha-N-acetylgalactosaminide alpha-2,6-sialyltransferase 1.1 [Pempheris klunzingeri]|uniref:alpha-N-acetylgalactosaminide alpha-2,6-sialyltransferase 1.1 n=1 Tax=Pempheris klunzingeri TaxID=3127111 RepID=UPI0039809891